jgi:hypothetical protein
VKPHFQRLAPEKNSSAYPHRWQAGDSANLAIDDIRQVCPRASDERCGLGQVQHLRESSTTGLAGVHQLRLAKQRSISDSLRDSRSVTSGEPLWSISRNSRQEFVEGARLSLAGNWGEVNGGSLPHLTTSLTHRSQPRECARFSRYASL